MVDKKTILILGAGGHAKVVIDTLLSADYSSFRLFDDDPKKIGTPVLNCLVEGTHFELINYFLANPASKAIVAIGMNSIREKVFKELQQKELVFVQAIHKHAIIAPTVKLGLGVMVMAGAVINSDATIGDDVIVNTGAVVEHDVRVGNHCHVGPNATLCGGVAVGEASLIGAGAVVLPNLTIGKNVIIGSGAVVLADAPDNSRLVGNPARLI